MNKKRNEWAAWAIRLYGCKTHFLRYILNENLDLSNRIFGISPAYRRTRDGYTFTVIKIEISQNCPRMLMQNKVTPHIDTVVLLAKKWKKNGKNPHKYGTFATFTLLLDGVWWRSFLLCMNVLLGGGRNQITK